MKAVLEVYSEVMKRKDKVRPAVPVSKKTTDIHETTMINPDGKKNTFTKIDDGVTIVSATKNTMLLQPRNTTQTLKGDK